MHCTHYALSRCRYRLCEIVDIAEHHRSYSFPSGKKTNLVVTLGFGLAEKQFKMSQCSDKSLEKKDVDAWLEIMLRDECKVSGLQV
jgi:hypothetical protein